MNTTDKVNFRGNFRQYDVDGKPYLYQINDAVKYRGQVYVATQPTSSKVPGTQEGNVYWKAFSENFYIAEYPPANPDVGDRWYVPSTSILYTRIQEESNKFWVEL